MKDSFELQVEELEEPSLLTYWVVGIRLRQPTRKVLQIRKEVPFQRDLRRPVSRDKFLPVPAAAPLCHAWRAKRQPDQNH
jgi:hypothetical protein